MSYTENTVLPAEGTTLSIDGTAVAQLLSVQPPGGEVESVRTWGLGDTHKTFRPGKIPDAGEIKFRILANGANNAIIAGLVDTPAVKTFAITYNDAHTTHGSDSFKGFVTKYEPDDLEDEKNFEGDVTVKITGPVTPTAGS